MKYIEVKLIGTAIEGTGTEMPAKISWTLEEQLAQDAEILPYYASPREIKESETRRIFLLTRFAEVIGMELNFSYEPFE